MWVAIPKVPHKLTYIQAFNMINLNARRIQLENRNAIEFAELERFGGRECSSSAYLELSLINPATAQNARVMQQYRKQAALLEQQLHRSRDDSVGLLTATRSVTLISINSTNASPRCSKYSKGKRKSTQCNHRSVHLVVHLYCG